LAACTIRSSGFEFRQGPVDDHVSKRSHGGRLKWPEQDHAAGRGTVTDEALSPRRAHPATFSRDTIKTGIGVASNATSPRATMHNADHTRRNRAKLMSTSS